MKNHRLKCRSFSLFTAILALGGCRSEKVESEKPIELVLEVSDSLQIDFLGEM